MNVCFGLYHVVYTSSPETIHNSVRTDSGIKGAVNLPTVLLLWRKTRVCIGGERDVWSMTVVLEGKFVYRANFKDENCSIQDFIAYINCFPSLIAWWKQTIAQ